jgi:uncharacterized protein (DUF58 family)
LADGEARWSLLPMPDTSPETTAARGGRHFARNAVYQFYARGTALNHWFRRRVRAPGIALLILVVISAGAAAGNAEPPVFQAFSLVCALLMTGLCLVIFRRASLEAVRELPAHATAGQPVTYHVSLRNLSGRPLKRFQLQETPPDPRPDEATFRLSEEPGEKLRNVFDRTFVYYRWNWLCERRLLFDGGSSSFVERLGTTAQISVTKTPRRRGLVRLNDLRVLLPDSLGLFQRCVKVPAPPALLAVLPKRYPLPRFELPGSARFQPGGEATARHAGATGEFTGLRDYQSGDPLRLIHWKTWARTGKPVVKELEDTFFPRHGLILDTFPGAGDDDLFEDAVSVAASFVVAVDARESLIDLMFIAGHPRVVTAGQGIARSETLLEVLAGVESSPVEDFDGLARLVQRHADDLAGCLCVFAGWSDSRAKLLQQLNRLGIETSAMVVVRERPGAVPRCHFLRSSELAADLMKLPRRL